MTMLLERAPLTEPVSPPLAVASLELELAARTIERVAADPFFVGHTLAVCKERFGIDEETLALVLGCPIATLPGLALSPRPDPTLPSYCRRLKCIAAATGADLSMLMALLELTEPEGGTQR